MSAQFRETRRLSLVGQLALSVQLTGVVAGFNQMGALYIKRGGQKNQQGGNHQGQHHQPQGHLHRGKAEAEYAGAREFIDIECGKTRNQHDGENQKNGANAHGSLVEKSCAMALSVLSNSCFSCGTMPSRSVSLRGIYEL